MRAEGVVFWLFTFLVFLLFIHTRGPGKLASWVVLLPLRSFIRALRRR